MRGSHILLTGATGYIGSRLLRVLEESGCRVRCLAREPERVAAGRSTTEVVAGDCLDEASLLAAMKGIDQAYYLVHSMADGPGFAALDRRAAANFGRAAADAGVRRIIYLGGLGDGPGSLSTHLKSRLETGEALGGFGVPVVEFRASIVVGAGSLSFEMIRALVERLPVMMCPRWVGTRTQPIAIQDVLAYLSAALDLSEGREAIFEIGGPDAVSYGDIMREYARLRGLRRLLIPVPLLTPWLSGLWLGLVTPAQARVGRALVEGLRNPTVVRSNAARETFGIEPMPLRDAVMRAIQEHGAPRRRLQRRTAQHAGPSRLSMFTYSSIIPVPAAQVFRWHEQPGALAALTPATLVRIEQQEGGIRDGGRVTLSIGIGPARLRMEVRHHSYIAGRRFCDEQVQGPMAVWRHAHLFEPIGASQALYQDRIEFAVFRRGALNRVAAALLRPVLTLAFAHRHRIVRASVGGARRPSMLRWTTAAVVVLAAAAALHSGLAVAQAAAAHAGGYDVERLVQTPHARDGRP
jgi:uncharacterized protein YbjT (DUF2867 family)/ligand-binding SRPBCC domain-containing protein